MLASSKRKSQGLPLIGLSHISGLSGSPNLPVFPSGGQKYFFCISAQTLTTKARSSQPLAAALPLPNEGQVLGCSCPRPTLLLSWQHCPGPAREERFTNKHANCISVLWLTWPWPWPWSNSDQGSLMAPTWQKVCRKTRLGKVTVAELEEGDACVSESSLCSHGSLNISCGGPELVTLLPLSSHYDTVVWVHTHPLCQPHGCHCCCLRR